ncbi:MAG TPA: CPBP family intramembrane glutamic endopeptidase, partial [Lachnospiraceae bacterium]|nr:CPBP family intramembrane glutamic endopeptidase [Lachnospiraceae bacterium]
ITGGLMLALKNDIITAIAKNVCSWVPTITLLILFPRLLPGIKRRDFFRSLFKNSISVKNLILLIFLQLFIFGASVTLYSHFSKVELNQLIGVSVPTIIFALVNSLTSGATGEESGWRGYLQPIMVKRYGLIKGSFVVGIIWALWHAPLWFISGEYVGLNLVKYICLFILFVVSTAVIIGISYEKNKNILVPVTIHFFVNFTLAFLKSNLLGVLFYIALFYFITAVGFAFINRNSVTLR